MVPGTPGWETLIYVKMLIMLMLLSEQVRGRAGLRGHHFGDPLRGSFGHFCETISGSADGALVCNCQTNPNKKFVLFL